MYFKYYFSKSSSLHFKKKNHFVLFLQCVTIANTQICSIKTFTVVSLFSTSFFSYQLSLVFEGGPLSRHVRQLCKQCRVILNSGTIIPVKSCRISKINEIHSFRKSAYLIGRHSVNKPFPCHQVSVVNDRQVARLGNNII